MSSSKNLLHRLTKTAIIAALYTVLSMVVAPIAFGPWQLRISEALTLLALAGFDEIYALTLGCFLTNLLGVLLGVNNVGVIDIVFGTIATFVAAVLTYRLRNVTFKGWPVLAAFMPVLMNGIIIGLELAIILGDGGSTLIPLWATFGLEVAVGELISVMAIGLPVWKFLLEGKLFNVE